jgi:lysozyme
VSQPADFYDRPALIAELQRDEGTRSFPFVDTTGHVTIGTGHNLSVHGLPNQVIALLLSDDIDAVIAGLDASLAWWRSLDPVRARVLLNMAFNLGVPGLEAFVHFLAAVQARDWSGAVTQMRGSLWHKQVGARATRLEAMMLTGAVA